jgi:hypothetical protein
MLDMMFGWETIVLLYTLWRTYITIFLNPNIGLGALMRHGLKKLPFIETAGSNL